MAALNVSPEALKDLQDIKWYITEELNNPSAAMRIVAKITKAMKRLKRFPGSGAPLAAHVVLHTDYRFLVCGNYLIFYRNIGQTVIVSRIFYGGRDYLSILFPKLPREDKE
jgi:plasmid stabilization system protein ParE